MIHLNRSLFLLLCLQLSLFSSLSQAKPHIPLGACGDFYSKHYKSIIDVQSSFNQLIGEWVIIEGIVTSEKLKTYDGFWLQQEKVSSDQRDVSSGIFVYHPRSSYKKLSITVGQHIRLLAQVADYHGLTELKYVKALALCANDLALPEASLITLPLTSLSELSALEGMRVSVKSNLKKELVISDLFGAGYGLGNYGQFAISSQLHFQPTELFRAAEIQSRNINILDKKLDYLLVDDGYSLRFPQFIPFPNSKGFSADNPLRIGDQISQVSAILHRYDNYYILIPEGTVSEVRINTRPRPKQAMVSDQANIVISSINVENYFNGNPKSFNNRDVGFPTSRGAKTYLQFVLQTQKLVAAMLIIDADVIALMELENDGYEEHSAIADLTRALNKKMPIDQQYRYVIPKQEQLGKDEISVGILYRSDKVTVGEGVHVLKYSKQVKYPTRPSLLQKFIVEDQMFYLAVSHFKSKGRPCDSKPKKQNAVQGNCNAVRKQTARVLSNYIDRVIKPVTPVLIVGDLNSYSQEDPLLVLEETGYTNINSIPRFNLRAGPMFSYSFQGYVGNLDHALANGAMLPLVRSIDSWSINASEDVLLRYDSQYAKPDAYRSSDHDPLVIGIEF